MENQFVKINGYVCNLKRDGVLVCDRILADLKDLKKQIQNAKTPGILNILLDISFWAASTKSTKLVLIIYSWNQYHVWLYIMCDYT